MQGMNGVLNPEASRLTIIYTIAIYLNSFIYSMGKNVLGMSALLGGNGMCFSRNSIEKLGWSSFSCREDFEQSIKYILSGFKIRFVPEAKVLSSMPEKLSMAKTQKLRWELHAIELFADTVKNMFKHFFVLKHPIQAMHLLMDVLRIKYSYLLIHSFVLAFISAFLDFKLFVFSGIIVVSVLMLPALVILRSKMPKKYFITVLELPIFLLWKIGIFWERVNFLHKRNWVRTKRE
jgi:cellulose synthase/poly-beta-1,6-N-acetylglucosamine synthase-like glycosyltransferase